MLSSNCVGWELLCSAPTPRLAGVGQAEQWRLRRLRVSLDKPGNRRPYLSPHVERDATCDRKQRGSISSHAKADCPYGLVSQLCQERQKPTRPLVRFRIFADRGQ